MDNLLRFDKKQKFLIFDFETEGLNLVSSRPYQLSWIVADQFKIYNQQDRFIWIDDLDVSAEAAEVTKFDFVSYKQKAEKADAIYKDFAKDLFDKDVIPIAHNLLGFDLYMIKNFQEMVNSELNYSFLNRSIDTKSLAIAIQKGISVPEILTRDEFILWQYSVTSIIEKGLKSSLNFLLKTYQIDFDPEKLHDGFYDVKMLYEVFLKQIFSIEIPNPTTLTV